MAVGCNRQVACHPTLVGGLYLEPRSVETSPSADEAGAAPEPTVSCSTAVCIAAVIAALSVAARPRRTMCGVSRTQRSWCRASRDVAEPTAVNLRLHVPQHPDGELFYWVSEVWLAHGCRRGGPCSGRMSAGGWSCTSGRSRAASRSEGARSARAHRRSERRVARAWSSIGHPRAAHLVYARRAGGTRKERDESRRQSSGSTRDQHR